MTSRQLRVIRGAAASCTATLLAAVSHTVGGATAPHPLFMMSLAVLLTPIATMVVGRRPARHRIAMTVLLAQLAFHAVFTLLGAPTAMTGTIGQLGHVHDMSALLVAQPDTAGVAALASGGWMLVAHLMAAIFTCMLLWHGEQLLRGVAGWVRAVLRRAAPITPACCAVLPVAVPSPAGMRYAALRTGLRLRGPPVTILG